MNFLGNQGDGITLERSDSNTINSNRISGNGTNGIDIADGSQNVLTHNTLTYNGNNGVSVLGASIANRISLNTIFSNARMRIDLGDDGPTPNDPGDTDTGPNNLQNFAAIVSAVTPTGSSSTSVRFTLDTLPGTYTIEFVGTAVSDVSGSPSDFSPSDFFTGSTTITVAANATTVYAATITAIPPGEFVTATATGSDGTSEFSPATPVVALPPRVLNASYVYFSPGHPLVIGFDQDVSASLTPAAVSLHNVQTGQDFTPARLTYDPSTNTARFFLPALLPNGDYVATVLASAVTNRFGQHLDGNRDGVPGDDFTFRFTYLVGDANGDHVVDFNDLLMLTQLYGARLNSGADINGDGVVNFADLLLLVQNYGRSVPAP